MTFDLHIMEWRLMVMNTRSLQLFVFWGLTEFVKRLRIIIHLL